MKLFIKTFGCRANQYDSEKLRAFAADSGVEVVGTASDADVAVFNSCAVTTEAEADLRQAVRRVARENPRITSYVMGCASALELRRANPDNPAAEERRPIRSLPTVAGIFEGADVEGVAAAAGMRVQALALTSHQSGSRALLRIQDGCDEHCTFCATTLARGSNRSRPTAELIEEAVRLGEHHHEIVLTGVHIGSYGTDCDTSLGKLVERLIAAVPHVRFRLSSLEATEVDDQLGVLLTSAPRHLAPYLHAPLQSGSDNVLRRMGRHWYTAAKYRSAIEGIAARASTFGLGADVISGFPGESSADHRATVQLIEDLPFTSLHVFPYSPRPGTAALKLGERVPGEVVAERTSELRALARSKAAAYAARRAGQLADVVVTGLPSREPLTRAALTEDYLTVQVSVSNARGSRFNAALESRDGALHAAQITS